MHRIIIIAFFFGVISNAEIDMNRVTLEAIAKMPSGGKYSRWKFNVPKLSIDNSGKVSVEHTIPSQCTTATYGVFLQSLADLHNQGRLKLSENDISLLRPPQNQDLIHKDGHGAWGYFNANGIGAARLVQKLGIGYSFRDPRFSEVKPGDYMKIFWNENIGFADAKYKECKANRQSGCAKKHSESGHQVIFTGTRIIDGEMQVCFFSSNSKENLHGKAGFGQRCVNRSRIKQAIFTRITAPGKISKGLAEEQQQGFVDTPLVTLATEKRDHQWANQWLNIPTGADSETVIFSARNGID